MTWLRHHKSNPWLSVPVASAMAVGLVGCVPSLAGPGYLSCLVAGLVLPGFVAVVTARRAAGSLEQPEREGLHSLGLGMAAAAAAYAMMLVQGLWVGLCEPFKDTLLFVLGPLFGCTLAGAWGAIAGTGVRAWITRRRRLWLVVFALAAPIGGIVWSLGRFYTSPMVFAFDPFFGFFAGTPYDTGFDPIPRLITYRLGSTATLLGVWLASRWFKRDPEGHLTWARPWDKALITAGSLALAFSLVLCGAGKELGHYSTAASIRERLGRTVIHGRCEVVFSQGIALGNAELLARDCDAWLKVLETRLGVAPLPRVTAFVFAHAGEKEAAMGAGHTQIAKPWRHEVYLNGAEFPHPVLGHELAHVVAGQTGRGPFRIAGGVFGWLPNAGLIEGLAMALAPDEDDDLSADEWAAALAELRQLPELSSLFSLSFLTQPGRLAYLVAGSFVAHVEKHFGAEGLRRWYAGQSLERVTGRDMKQLETDWRASLLQIKLPQSAREAAKSLFERKSALVRHCPHAIDRAISDAADALNAQEPERACLLTDSARALDESNLRLRFLAAECRHRSGENRRATEAWQQIAGDSSLPQPERDRAAEALADRTLERGEYDQARLIYDELRKRTLDVDRARTLEVKAAVHTPEGIAAIQALITGGREGANWDRGVARLAEWMAASPDDGLPRYLLGRNLFSRGHFREADLLLGQALGSELDLPLVKSEAQRLALILACTGAVRAELIQQLLPEILADETMPAPRRAGTAALARRCLGATALNAPQPEAKVGQKPKVESAPPPTVASATALACPKSMVAVAGADGWIGSNPHVYSPEEGPRFKVRMASFCLDQTEITLDAFQACVSAGKCEPPRGDTSTCNVHYPERGNHPVNCVSYHQAEAYCRFKNARLPTEFEWEFAASGGPLGLKYPWGSDSPEGHVCWKQANTCPVKSYPPGAYGLYDMSGNVWEWTSSDFGPYPFPPVPAPDDSVKKVYRGGSWSRRFEKWMHLGLRNRFKPEQSGSHLGFRCAVTPPGVECAAGRDAEGQCMQSVLEVECDPGEVWNGYRCAKPGSADCPDGSHVVAGHGCQLDVALHFGNAKLDLAPIERRRSPEFDADCQTNQPARPKAYQLSGGEHLARNAYARRDHCKNRDVGVGWNSVCCP